MPSFRNKDLAALAHQLTLLPKRQRLAQVRGIEQLLAVVKPDKSYPYDMVCYQITGYRNRREPDKCIIPGDVLISDVTAIAEHITRKSPIPLEDISNGHFASEDLADRLSVSTKTLRRWRRRGLMSIRAQFDDGVARLVYLKETVDRFTEQNKRLVARGAAFRQLSEDEKTHIVDLARERLAKRRQKLHVIARQIAEETGRAIETVRYTLRRFDEAHPESALFVGDGLPMVEPGHKAIWKAHRSGDDVATIARTFKRPVRQVRAVVREMQARRLKCDPVRYIYHDLFAAPDADEIILDAPPPPAPAVTRRVRAPRDLPAYLRSLYDIPLMSAEQEADAFRRYNYLKYKTACAIEAIDVLDVQQAQIDEVLALRRQYVGIRKQIVRANLRLVVSIAKKHVGRSANFFEVVSDGNMSLLRAVEKFDYSRGFKFSTYASWAIMKNYARTIPSAHYQKARFVTGQDELLDGAADTSAAPEPQLEDRTLADILKGCMSELTDRERHIVTAHFGLFGQDAPRTLEQLGDEYGVTKERIRQIERRAIGKLKETLSPSVADLLPG